MPKRNTEQAIYLGIQANGSRSVTVKAEDKTILRIGRNAQSQSVSSSAAPAVKISD